MTLALIYNPSFELDLHRLKMNDSVKYLGEKLFRSKVIVRINRRTGTQTHTHTHTHTTHTQHTTTEYADVSTTYLELFGNTPFKDTRMADRCEAWRRKGGILPGSTSHKAAFQCRVFRSFISYTTLA